MDRVPKSADKCLKSADIVQYNLFGEVYYPKKYNTIHLYLLSNVLPIKYQHINQYKLRIYLTKKYCKFCCRQIYLMVK